MSVYDKLDDETERADTEITLGLRSILGIFFGLVLICGVFFGFGYSLGRSNAVKPSAAPQAASQPAAPAPSPVTTVVQQPSSTTASASPAATDPYNFNTNASNPPKPSGAILQPVAPATPSTTATAPQSTVAAAPASPGSNTAGTAQSTPASYTIISPHKSAQPAIPAVATTASQSPIMVQIAAISRPQDADVLISALQKRGFNASARREASDNLLHVQVGPFATRAQAMTMRTRLLNDGYNAILK
jgi:DedD protein